MYGGSITCSEFPIHILVTLGDNMRGLVRLKKYQRNFNDFIDPKAVILMYHRVTELPDYTSPLAVTPEHFRQQMAYLRRSFQPIWLDELAGAVKRGSIPRQAVAITFDDGYADNYMFALPILEEFKIPATIFVTSGSIDSDREYWWDDLERIFLRGRILPETLEICVNGHEYFWTLDNAEKLQSIRKELHQIIKPLRPDYREQILEILTKWANLGRGGRRAHRAMTFDELKTLAGSSVIQIGGHTVNHPQLAALPVELQVQEILQGRDELETVIGKRVKTFSYPFGGQMDFSAETVDIVKKAGFEAACSTQYARVTRRTEIHALPRFWVGDWGIKDFEFQIAKFFQK
jgi:peptidoglycan/xylan/chitin deacetylase (PgdA/CDA1 family)